MDIAVTTSPMRRPERVKSVWDIRLSFRGRTATFPRFFVFETNGDDLISRLRWAHETYGDLFFLVEQFLANPAYLRDEMPFYVLVESLRSAAEIFRAVPRPLRDRLAAIHTELPSGISAWPELSWHEQWCAQAVGEAVPGPAEATDPNDATRTILLQVIFRLLDSREETP